MSNEAISADGRLVRVSASQIETFIRAPRKWFYEKKLKLPKRKMSGGAATGTEGHLEVEDLLKNGIERRGPFALAGKLMLEPYLEHSPFNGGAGLVECALTTPTLETPEGVMFTGRIDYFIPTSPPVIIDHKFKKDLSKHGKSETELADDTQAVVYGMWAVERTGEKEVEFRHHNHATDGSNKAKPVSVRLTRTQLLKKFGVICDLVDTKMSQAAKKIDPLDIECNTKACYDFGCCDYANVCPAAPKKLKEKRELEILKEAQKEEDEMKAKDTKVDGTVYDLGNKERGTRVIPLVLGKQVRFKNAEGKIIFVGENAEVEPVEVTPAPAIPPPVEVVPDEEGSIETTPFDDGTEIIVNGKSLGKVKVLNMNLPTNGTPAVVASESKRVFICLNVPVSGEDTRDFTPYVNKIHDMVKAKYNVPDARHGGKHPDLAYAAWQATLGLIAKAHPPEPGTYVAANGAICRAIIEGLDGVPGITIVGNRSYG